MKSTTTYHENSNQKKGGVVILMSDKVNCIRNIPRHKQGYYTMIKGSVHQEDITILNIYAPNNISSKYTKQKFLEKK